MYFSEISGLTAKELTKMKKELQGSMFEARMKNTLGQLANQMVIRDARKDISRINTALARLVSGSAAAPAKKSAKAAKPSKMKTAPRGKKG
jgi:ribosomal protein L29